MRGRVELPYGVAPYPDLAGRDATVVLPPPQPAGTALGPMPAAARDAPLGLPRLEALVPRSARVTVIVSDATPSEPRAAFLQALLGRLPDAHWTLAIATGTHGPARVEDLGIPEVGPLGVVNGAIIRVGAMPRLAPDVTLRMVSSLPPAEVARSLFAGAESGAALIASQAGSITIVPRASQLIGEAA